MMAAQPNSRNRVKLAWCVTLTFTCLLLPAPARADGGGGDPQRPQDPVPLTKEVLINKLEMKRAEMVELKRAERRERTLDDLLDRAQAEFLELVQKRGVSFRVMPAEEREIRKAGDYLIAGDLEKLIVALRNFKNYRPETTLSGRIEQVRVTDNPDGGIYLFIELKVSNAGAQSVANNYVLRIMQANSGSLTLNGGAPAQMREPFKVTGDGETEVVIRPEDSLVQKTRQVITEGQPVSGWLKFDLPAVRKSARSLPLRPENLRRCGTWYVVTFADFKGEVYEATYEMN